MLQTETITGTKRWGWSEASQWWRKKSDKRLNERWNRRNWRGWQNRQNLQSSKTFCTVGGLHCIRAVHRSCTRILEMLQETWFLMSFQDLIKFILCAKTSQPGIHCDKEWTTRLVRRRNLTQRIWQACQEDCGHCTAEYFINILHKIVNVTATFLMGSIVGHN